ncbi:Hypothetical protein R9X50_00017200 [Acrodontium crateriforme]|uniref:Importin N-terminal domain-containing protein n=1 Tax=Acrodontium crateriforme TaxID=150365 RepID=A0AAQ3LZU7_9PEZI|nr:Hypothetical protein R9X50_00017200 [Acrodontium crateriforme]
MNGDASTQWQPPSNNNRQLESITAALAANLNPRISNDIRQQALQHLEEFKTQPDAPQYGFTLADDRTQENAVRYYGLQLLEFAIRYRWHNYSAGQTEQLRAWVLTLADGLNESDPLFIRNKIAQLWVELAKRCWGDEWMDMDQQLVNLWEKPIEEKGVAMKTFVLGVMETLSEDIINSEDAVAGLRLEVLGHALNEIMIPERLYNEHTTTRSNKSAEVRYGSAGWLSRICEVFATCVKQVRVGRSVEMTRSIEACAVKALNALRPTMAWISLKAAVEVNCVDCLFLPFHTDDVALQTAAMETLYALLVRPWSAHWAESWTSLVQQAMRADRIMMIRHTFQAMQTGPGEDDAKYMLQKKMSEVLSLLSDFVGGQPQLAGNSDEMSAFFDLLLNVLQSKSLIVSIPILHSWSRLMNCQNPLIIDVIHQALGALIQTCSERLIRYESLPEDSEDPIIQFLYEDFDTMPERHAFLGNYRRYCVSIVQSIARWRPMDALSHVLDEMRALLQEGPYTGSRGFNPETYSKQSLPVLRFEAQYTIVSSALKGFSLWTQDTAGLSPENEIYQKAENDRSRTAESLQQWSYAVIDMHVDDPEVAAQVLQTLVSILKTIKPSPTFVLHVVQHLLTMRVYDNPQHTAFSETVKVFEGLRVLELQKLALAFSTELLEVYHELEPRIGVLAQKHDDDPRLAWSYKAFLFMIIQRAGNIESNMRVNRLQQMLKPVYDAWQEPSLSASLVNLQTFCESLDLGNIAEFYKTYRFDQLQDWSTQQLDSAGQARQARIKEKNDRLPLRMTKSMLAASTEKLKSGTDEYEIACSLWGHIIPGVLPKLLQMLRHASAFHNMENWSNLPNELQAVIKRTLQDRFWQSGISNESKDEFYARVSGSKTSYEGFASVVRGSMRNTREQGYHIIYLMTKFDEHFYGVPELAEPLANALFSDTQSLSANHLHPIINLTTGIVQRCPPHRRTTFLPPLLTQLFTKLDAKISSEWQSIEHASQQNTVEDELSDEMRTESVLRQLTYSMVSFVPFLLEFEKTEKANGNTSHKPSFSDMMLSDPTILEPMILFCTHALRMRDTRSCSTICRVFRNIIPLFQSDDAPGPQVREFICTEVLKACITSLNEPYFADMQKDLAALIAQIISLYGSKSETPLHIVLSLPDMSPDKVNRALRKIRSTQSERQQRAIILDLLENVRGVSIYEAGKLSTEAPKKSKSGVQQQYMTVVEESHRPGEDEGLEGIAGMFGDA